jgi:ribosomal protein L12E/L44/L45/RPP1/RPP2
LETAVIANIVYPLDGQQADELIQQAQAALNAVQEAGGASYRFPAAAEM